MADETAVSAVAQDVVDTAALGKKVVAAFKTGGVQGATALISDVLAAGEKDYADIAKALPDIKAGYKTTEFWLTVGVIVVNGVYTLITGKMIPVDLNLVLGGIVAIYTAARALVKNSASKAAVVAAK